MTRIALVVAHTRNRVIGRDNTMPWNLPADLRRFRALTMGHPILMGRRTHQAIGRPLPGRRNLVLTRQPEFAVPGVETVGSLEHALAVCQEAPWLYVIGGGEVYAQALPLAERLHLTEIAADIDGDACFPEIDHAQWLELSSEEHPADTANAYALRFLTLDRKR